MIEYQSAIATRTLTDTDAQQALLERLIDQAKPPAPPTRRGLHYLLATPFRYPPLKYGSRFGGRHEPSLWYGARQVATCLAERAFYLFADWSLSHAPARPIQNRFTAFAASVRTSRGLDLTADAFARHQRALASPTEYADAQATGTRMRAAGIEAFTYRSARDADGGQAVALFTPAAFAKPDVDPTKVQTWALVNDRKQITFVRGTAAAGGERLTLRRDAFLVGGKMPVPVA